MKIADRIEQRLADAGLDGSVHATNLASGAQIAYKADEPTAMASLYKLPLLIAFAREWQDERIDPAEILTVEPDRLTAGPTGLSTLIDPLTTSLRNLAVLMATLSDNAAADILLERVGLDAIQRILSTAEVTTTHVRLSSREINRTLIRQTRVRTLPRAFAKLASNDELYGDHAYDPQLTSPTTSRDMTSLLRALWAGDLVSSKHLAFVQTAMRQQIWPHRLRAGFPYSTVRIAGKTGTLGALRHEVGVIEFPNEPPYAIAVLTRAARADAILPSADRAIADIARTTITELRAGV